MSDFRAILARAKHRAAKVDGFRGPYWSHSDKTKTKLSTLNELGAVTTCKDVVVSLVPSKTVNHRVP